MRGAGAGAIHRPATDRSREDIATATAGFFHNDEAGAAKLFASVKRQLDRENPGYER